MLAVSANDVNEYGKGIGIKNNKIFRTLQGCMRAEEAIGRMTKPKEVKGFAAARKEVGKYVSKFLNNGPAQALDAYIDSNIFRDWAPDLFEEWEAAEADRIGRRQDKKLEKIKEAAGR